MPYQRGHSGSAGQSGSHAAYQQLRTMSSRSRPNTTGTTISYHENDIVCAISEARGISPTVGLAFVNLTTSEAIICQLSDTQTFAKTCHKLFVFSPTEIVHATTATDSKLISVIRENLRTDANNIKMTAIDRRYWSESAGHEYVQTLAFPCDLESLNLSIASNYYAICCFAAAMKYVNLSMGVTFASQNVRIRAEPSEGAMMIGLSTLASLELVQNALDSKSKDCLFGLLNTTRTRMGARFLKANILQPSTDENKLIGRYAAVAELCQKDSMLSDVRQALAGIIDTDKLLASLILIQKRLDFTYMEQSVNKVIILKSFVDSIMPIWQALAGVASTELQDIQNLCDPANFADIKDLLHFALNDDVRFSSRPTELRNQRVWAWNAGVNGFLDAARQNFSDVGQEVDELIQKLKDDHDFNFDLKFDTARQYFIAIKSNALDDTELPDVFINVYRNRKFIECQTMELVKLNQKLKDAHNEVIILSDQSIQELISNVRAKLQPLFKISEAIALLDMLASFAELGVRNHYVQPELTSTLAIESGRHPVRENIQSENFIPNDVYATQQSRFQIITGCNMSGKSTYTRAIALIAVMAQIGCFVPADYASLPIVHQLFARVSMDDNMETNASTFASEMQDMTYILHNVEPRSLVIVDELGRGTSIADGLAIAIAIAEALIASKAMVWFVTHFRDLPRILAQRAGVVNLHLTVDFEHDFSVMKMRYKISDGMEEEKFYGLAMARLVDLPSQVVEIASEISERLNNRMETQKNTSRPSVQLRRQRLVLKLREQLLQAAECENKVENLQSWLKRLQEEFVIRMSMLDAEG